MGVISELIAGSEYFGAFKFIKDAARRLHSSAYIIKSSLQNNISGRVENTVVIVKPFNLYFPAFKLI
jgi:hypothetical protein